MILEIKIFLITKLKNKEKNIMFIFMLILQLVILIISITTIIYLITRKNTMECFYIENEILYLNSMPTKKIPLSDIDYIEFYCSRFRNNCRGLIKIHTINSKVVKRFFQTSKFTFFVTEQMVLDEINKLTPILKEYSIPYTINYN